MNFGILLEICNIWEIISFSISGILGGITHSSYFVQKVFEKYHHVCMSVEEIEHSIPNVCGSDFVNTYLCNF